MFPDLSRRDCEKIMISWIFRRRSESGRNTISTALLSGGFVALTSPRRPEAFSPAARCLTRILHENAKKHGEDLDAENVANTADGNGKLPSEDFVTYLCARDSRDSSGLHAIFGLNASSAQSIRRRRRGSENSTVALSFSVWNTGLKRRRVNGNSASFGQRKSSLPSR